MFAHFRTILPHIIGRSLSLACVALIQLDALCHIVTSNIPTTSANGNGTDLPFCYAHGSELDTTDCIAFGYHQTDANVHIRVIIIPPSSIERVLLDSRHTHIRCTRPSRPSKEDICRLTRPGRRCDARLMSETWSDYSRSQAVSARGTATATETCMIDDSRR